MGLENLKQELDFLTGRYTMKKRPVHGRLFSTPSRLSYGPDLLEDVSIEGRKMRVPTPPRPYPSPSSAGYVRRGYGGSGEGSPICAELGEVRVVITPRMRQRLSALDLQHLPTYQPVTLVTFVRCAVNFQAIPAGKPGYFC